MKYYGIEDKEAEDAVKNDCYSLRYVEIQTESICKAAVKNDGDALRYVEIQTESICKAAV